MNVDATDGATANAASAAAVSFRSSDINVLSPPAADDTTMPTASAAATLADPPSPGVVGGSADGVTVTADSAADSGMHGASGASVAKKRRRKHGHATQDSRKHRRRMADFAAAQGGTSGSDPGPARGASGGGSD